MTVRWLNVLPVILLHAMAIRIAVAQQAPTAPPGGGGGGPFAGSPDLPGNLFNSAHKVAQSTLTREWVYVPLGQDRLRTLIVYPSGDAPTSVVLLLHNELGLDSLQQALALQLAQHGFIAVAPDLLSGLGPNGGNYDSFAFPDAALRAVREITPAEATRRHKVAYDHARTLPRGNGKVAALGSGLGGTHSFLLAAEVPDLGAAVVLYGLPPNERALSRINAPVLGLYGGDDPDVVATVEPTAAAMTRFGKSYESHVYPGATHAFMTYVVEGRNGEAIAAAWPAAIAFLNQYTK
jgi:carboxymethylenebutenolidase